MNHHIKLTSQIVKTFVPSLAILSIHKRLFMNHNIDVWKVDSTFDHCVIVSTSYDNKQVKN